MSLRGRLQWKQAGVWVGAVWSVVFRTVGPSVRLVGLELSRK